MGVLGDVGTFEFTSVRDIGGGGLGKVDEIEVVRSWNGHPVGSRWARKRLNDKFRQYPDARERFEREIAAIKEMSHPAIVAYRGENIDGGERFYLMPLYPRSLRDLLMKTQQGFGWPNVAGFGIAIAGAMEYAHSNGFKHRDLKPENILLDDGNNPVIADWGLGYFIHKESKVLQLTKAGMGTEYYCCREQWITGKCDNTGDIYSLGLVLAELVTGTRREIVVGMGMQKDVVLNASYGAQVFNSVIKTMTKPNAGDRLQSMAFVSHWLGQATAQAQTPPR